MKVILREPVESLGSVGKEVSVAKGYARNYLFPQKKAVLATPANRVLIERERKKLEIKAAKDKEQAEIMAKAVEGVVCAITAKVSEDDRLYGSVGRREIEKKLMSQGLDIHRKMILLPEPIKQVGSYVVPIQIHPEIKVKITVNVVPEESAQ